MTRSGIVRTRRDCYHRRATMRTRAARRILLAIVLTRKITRPRVRLCISSIRIIYNIYRVEIASVSATKSALQFFLTVFPGIYRAKERKRGFARDATRTELIENCCPRLPVRMR